MHHCIPQSSPWFSQHIVDVMTTVNPNHQFLYAWSHSCWLDRSRDPIKRSPMNGLNVLRIIRNSLEISYALFNDQMSGLAHWRPGLKYLPWKVSKEHINGDRQFRVTGVWCPWMTISIHLFSLLFIWLALKYYFVLVIFSFPLPIVNIQADIF